MRTREEIIAALSHRKEADFFKNSTWSDLVEAVGTLPTQQKTNLLKAVLAGDRRTAGDVLVQALIEQAGQRARTRVESLFVNDSLSLTEIDELL